MNSVHDVLGRLSQAVDARAAEKGYGDSEFSYAYKYGFFTSQVANLLDGILTEKQLKQLAKAVERM